MASIASFADWVRLYSSEPQKLPGGAEAHADIEAALKGSDDWHFVDLPLGSGSYSTNLPSTGPNDVVGGIGKCIAILEGPEQMTAGGRSMHNLALMFLVHLVGDIHQPFHVACRYYRPGPVSPSTIVTDPKLVAAGGLLSDRGANNLTYSPPTNNELHALWDDNLVLAVGALKTDTLEQRPGDINTMVALLKPKLGHTAKNTGDYHGWAAQWASDALPAAWQAYNGVSILSAVS